MNAAIFAEWLRRQGYRVVRTPSSYWCEVGLRVYQAFPYYWQITPTETEVSRLLREHAAIALRYSTSVAAPQGKVSYHVVCERPYDQTTLPRTTRQNVTRGLQYAHVEPIPFSRLATEGWAMRLDTLQRQGRVGAEHEAWWHRLCHSANDLLGFEAWGAIHDGELVSSCLAFVCDDCYTVPYQQSASAHLEHRVNNALFFEVACQALRRPGIGKVFFCLQSLDAPGSVDDFKFRMGFTALPVRQRVVFHPWLAPFLGAGSHAGLKRWLARYPQNATLAKAEGMLRFYLDSQCSPEQQDWPEGLASRRNELLAAL